MSLQSPLKRRIMTAKIVTIYALFGLAWIYGSDTVFGWLVHDPAVMVKIAVIKGSLFILCTAALLYILISRFVLELSAAERKQIGSLGNYEAIFNATNEVIFVHDAESERILDINDRIFEIYGYRRDEALTLDICSISEGTPPYSQIEALEKVRMALHEGPQVFEWLCRKKSGELFWTEVSLRKITTQDNDRILAVVRDINDRKQADEALRMSAEKNQAILNLAMDGFWCVSQQGRLQEVNEAYCRMSGYSKQELSAMSIADLEVNETATDAVTHNQKIMAQGEDRFVSQHRRKDGSVFDVEVSTKFIPVYGGLLVGFIRDITEQKLKEEALHKSELLFRSLVENSTDITFSLSSDGVFIYVSPNWKEAFGYELAETVGKSFVPFVHPDDIGNCFAFLQQVLESGEKQRDFEYRVRHKNGTWIWYAANGSYLFDAENIEITFLGIGRDINNRKMLEEKLKITENKFQSLFENMTDGFAAIDMEGSIVEFNNAFCEMIGYTAEELYNLKYEDITPARWHATEREIIGKQVMVRGYSDLYEKEYRRKDGSIVSVDSRTYVFRNKKGSPYGMWAFIRDITERKQVEAELSMAKVAAEAASFAKSRFLANMSHEIRTPMSGIIGIAELLETTELTEEQREYVDIFKQSANNLLKLISDILDLSKIEAGKVELENNSFDLKDEINGTASIFSLLAQGKGLAFSFLINPDVPLFLKGDADRLRQIITNLLGNSIKFTSKGSISLHISKEAEDEQGTTLRFQVCDSGIGISSDHVGNIFEAFNQADSSTNRKYGGTGLGLSITHHLVELMGGSIGVASVEGEGAAFWFTALFEKQTKTPAFTALEMVSDVQDIYDPEIRILLIDDDTTNQFVTSRFLAMNGNQVDVANNGCEGLKLLEENDYDLVLMDCMMPLLNGYEATAAIRSQTSKVRNHAIPVIGLTANATREDRDNCLAAGMDDYLSKPCPGEELLVMLEKWLKPKCNT